MSKFGKMLGTSPAEDVHESDAPKWSPWIEKVIKTLDKDIETAIKNINQNHSKYSSDEWSLALKAINDLRHVKNSFYQGMIGLHYGSKE